MHQLDKKFNNNEFTAKGEPRAFVHLDYLKTLWFNTGTLCNLTCQNCYIESSPKNDRLSYLQVSDVIPFLDEIKHQNLGTQLIGLTGGEPFINPQIQQILEVILSRGYELLILTNAYKVMQRHHDFLLNLQRSHADKLHIRVSLDHYTQTVHENERGIGTFIPTLEQIKWLYENNFNLSIAGRSLLSESNDECLVGYKKLFESYNISLSLPEKIVIFPEMQSGKDVPEISTACWKILSKNPQDQMCASERMIVKPKAEETAKVMPCTLLAYDEKFILGNNLTEASRKVFLNHRFCAEFCVLGGASCSSTK